MRSAASPLSWMNAMCESKSVASSEKSPFWLSQIPSASMLISRNFLIGREGSRSGGNAARSWPMRGTTSAHRWLDVGNPCRKTTGSPAPRVPAA